ncbi:MAG: hypothetical protein M3Z24_09910 [Chloroflexota bacterium]|nr:hypothetical protein [Chloroflexota bacterium]
MPDVDEQHLSLRDIIDSQLETRDHIEISRVDDVEAELRDDGSLVLSVLVTGPQALAGRVATPLRFLLRSILRDRFEHRIPLFDVKNFGPTLRLSGTAKDYPTGKSDPWIADHILRWIPGNGRKHGH